MQVILASLFLLSQITDIHALTKHDLPFTEQCPPGMLKTFLCFSFTPIVLKLF